MYICLTRRLNIVGASLREGLFETETLENAQLFTRRDLIRLLVPLAIEQLLAITMGMADTLMVSSVGEAAVSGISLVDSINLLLVQVFAALCTGGAVVAAQYLGRQDRKAACASAKQLVYATAALSVLVTAFSLLFNRGILGLVFGRIEPDVMKNAQTYFVLSAVSYPFVAIYSAAAALFRAMGNSRTPMSVALLMNIINVAANALFLYVFKWGIFGIALSTVLARAVASITALLLLRNSANKIFIERMFSPEFHWPMVKRILHIGIPNGLENSMFQVGKLAVQSLVATLGTAAIAANAVANVVAGLGMIPGLAVSISMITVVGQCTGARDFDQASANVRRLMGLGYVAITALNIPILLLARPLALLFNLSDAALSVAVVIIAFHSICAPLLWLPSFALPNALRAAGDVRFTMIAAIISMWTCRIGFSYLLSGYMNFGVMGIWIAMVVDWVARAAAFVIRFARGKWKEFCVIE